MKTMHIEFDSRDDLRLQLINHFRSVINAEDVDGFVEETAEELADQTITGLEGQATFTVCAGKVDQDDLGQEERNYKYIGEAMTLEKALSDLQLTGLRSYAFSHVGVNVELPEKDPEPEVVVLNRPSLGDLLAEQMVQTERQEPTFTIQIEGEDTLDDFIYVSAANAAKVCARLSVITGKDVSLWKHARRKAIWRGGVGCDGRTYESFFSNGTKLEIEGFKIYFEPGVWK